MMPRPRVCALACAAALAIASGAVAQTPSPSPTPSPSSAPKAAPKAAPSATPGHATGAPVPVPTLTLAPEDPVPSVYVHGQVLTIGHGFLVFTTGDALRLRAGTVVPKGTTTGSVVRVTLDQLTRDVKAIEFEPRISLAGEVDATGLGSQYVVRSPGSAPAPTKTDSGVPLSNQLVNVTILVNVPANTPLGQDIYIATDRSSFSPAELRLTLVDARHYTTGLSLPVGSRLRYIYTRGSNATVERERNGDISKPHEFVVAPNEKIEDTVPRWADLN